MIEKPPIKLVIFSKIHTQEDATRLIMQCGMLALLWVISSKVQFLLLTIINKDVLVSVAIEVIFYALVIVMLIKLKSRLAAIGLAMMLCYSSFIAIAHEIETKSWNEYQFLFALFLAWVGIRVIEATVRYKLFSEKET